MTTIPSPPRVAIIGVSGYGKIHLQLARASQARGEIRITAATIINPQEEAVVVAGLAGDGCEIFTDYAEMLRQHADRIDLCLIPTGIHWHARMTIAALEAGANVLVEKPLAGSLAEVAAIRQAEQRTGRFVAVGFQDIYDPATNWLKDELQRGVIGDINSVRFLGIWPRPRSYYTRNNWAGRLQVAGAPVLDSPLNNAFAHFVMLSLFYAETTRPVASPILESVELWRAHNIESYDTAVVRSRTAAGVKMWFGASHACGQAIEPEIVITGRHGQAGWRYETEAWWNAATGANSRRPLLDISGARQAMFSAALGRLDNPTTPIATTELAARHTAMIVSIQAQGHILDTPPSHISWTGTPDSASALPNVQDLAESLRSSYAKEQTLAASGFSLAGAVPGL